MTGSRSSAKILNDNVQLIPALIEFLAKSNSCYLTLFHTASHDGTYLKVLYQQLMYLKWKSKVTKPLINCLKIPIYEKLVVVQLVKEIPRFLWKP